MGVIGGGGWVSRAGGALVGAALPVLALATLAISSASGAAPFSVSLEVGGEADEGAINLVSAVVRTAAAARCELRVRAGGRTTTLESRHGGSVVWRWTAPADAPRGVWSFVATCRGGGYWAWRRADYEMGFPRRGGALVAPPEGGGVGKGESCDSQGVCFEDDPFAVGQCGWYAEGRRPDLLGIVGIHHDDSGAWLEEAVGKVPEGSVPVVGALAVWAPNVRGYSGPLGHVAYVAAVSGSRIFVEDSNWEPTPWSPGLEVHEHWDPASSVTGYIYGGPAGSGPV